MDAIRKHMICYSRLDFTTHYSCRVSSAEFPWAIQVLCWCKGEQKLVLFFCVVSIWFHLFKHLVYVFVWTVSPSSLPFGGGCHFQRKFSIKGKGQALPFTPCATCIKGAQHPQNTNVLITMGLETVFKWTHVPAVLPVVNISILREALAMSQWFCRLCLAFRFHQGFAP